MNWKTIEERYGNAKVLFLGKWRVSKVFFDGSRSNGDRSVYRADLFLPGMKPTIGHFELEEDAMAAAEKAVKYWVDQSGIGDNSIPTPTTISPLVEGVIKNGGVNELPTKPKPNIPPPPQSHRS
jgi:hypothetical protein